MNTQGYRLWPFILFMIFAVVILSCTKEKIVTPEHTIFGSWTRAITDTEGVQFNAELKINTDNSFEFILLEEVPGHTNSSGEFTLSDDIFTIINDTDCDSDGVYEFVVTDEKLALVVVMDDCAPRVVAIQGVWGIK